MVRSLAHLPIILIVAAALTAWPALPQSPHDAVPDVAIGKRIFESQCALCHGQDGTGGRGPSLARPKLNKAPNTEALRKAISEGIQPEMPGAWQLSIREVASVAAFVESLGSVAPEVVPGHATRGFTLFQTRGCSDCHIIDGDGTARGPELSGVGARRNARHIRESIVSPEKVIPDGFLIVEAVTASGAALRGVKDNEDPFTLQMTATDGKRHSLRKAGLRSLRRLTGVSTMPSYASTLTPAELDDLVAYLVSRRDAK